MVDNVSKSKLRDTWESAARGWAKWEHAFATSLSNATEAMFDMALVGPGMRVLDLACGAGSQSIQAARRVGSNGKVVAADISSAMLDYVRRNADSAGLQNIETRESAAEDLQEAKASFDASICRLGLMLFPAPHKALASVRIALKPGARFAALVFTTPANNPFMAQPMAILLRHAGKTPPAPGQPGIFALGAAGAPERLMKDSGFQEVQTEIVRAPFLLPSAADALHLMQEAAGAYRAVVADLSDAEKSHAWIDVHECLKQFESGGSFRTELEVVIVSGANPR